MAKSKNTLYGRPQQCWPRVTFDNFQIILILRSIHPHVYRTRSSHVT